MHGHNIGRISWNGMFRAVAAAVFVAEAGCWGAGGLPEGETGTVKGKVTHQGKPIPQGATVVFANEKHGIVATGTVSAGGAYTLQMRGGPDVLAGQYKVAGTPPPSTQPKMSDEEYEKYMQGPVRRNRQNRKNRLRYTAPETSDLTAQVKAGENIYDLDLRD